jgi:hypothetical protein
MLCDGAGWGEDHHFFFCSSMETPPGPRDTTISRPPITERVWGGRSVEGHLEIISTVQGLKKLLLQPKSLEVHQDL